MSMLNSKSSSIGKIKKQFESNINNDKGDNFGKTYESNSNLKQS
jgi:hypothetical protein